MIYWGWSQLLFYSLCASFSLFFICQIILDFTLVMMNDKWWIIWTLFVFGLTGNYLHWAWIANSVSWVLALILVQIFVFSWTVLSLFMHVLFKSGSQRFRPTEFGELFSGSSFPKVLPPFPVAAIFWVQYSKSWEQEDVKFFH